MPSRRLPISAATTLRLPSRRRHLSCRSPSHCARLSSTTHTSVSATLLPHCGYRAISCTVITASVLPQLCGMHLLVPCFSCIHRCVCAAQQSLPVRARGLRVSSHRHQVESERVFRLASPSDGVRSACHHIMMGYTVALAEARQIAAGLSLLWPPLKAAQRSYSRRKSVLRPGCDQSTSLPSSDHLSHAFQPLLSKG